MFVFVCLFFKGIREKEHQKLRNMAYLNSLSISTAPTIPIISAVVTFLIHIGTGHTLSAAQVFCNADIY